MSASAPDWRIVLIALLYSIGAHGIMTLNDFKSVEGDERMGIDSLPVLLGVDNAARFACLVMVVPQVAVVAMLLAWQQPIHAAAVGALVLVQLLLMVHFLKGPRERAPGTTGPGSVAMSSVCSSAPLRWLRCRRVDHEWFNALMVRHRQTWPDSDRPRCDRRVDDIDAEPSHGDRTGDASHSAGRSRRYSLCSSGLPAGLGPWFGSRGPSDTVDRRRHGGARNRRLDGFDRDGLDDDAALFGIALAVVAFCLIGAGVGAAGTSLLVLLAKRTDDNRRAAAATIVWVMMIAGFIVTTVVAGHWLDPFSPMRLIIVSGSVSVAAMVLTIIGVWGVEGGSVARAQLVSRSSTRQPSFRDAFMEVWHEPKSRRFAIFVFVSMLAYSAQDLILEPFAGAVFAFTPGETTKLSGVQHAGTLIGMALVPLIGAVYPRSRVNLQLWTVGGCLASAIALLCLAAAAIVGPSWPLRETVFMLGVTNGAYAVAAIGSMMVLISAGDEKREGVRMGLWGASQAFAFGIGGFLGTLASDIARYVLTSAALSYFAVFASEAGLFVIAAVMAVWVHRAPTKDATQQQVFNLPIATVTEGARS